METIIIKATIADTIARIVFYKTYNPTKISEKYFDNSSDRSELINALKECYSFTILNEDICCVVPRDESDIQKEIEENSLHMGYGIAQLKKWGSLNDDNRKQIVRYLEFKGLHWILEHMNNAQKD